MKNQQGFISHEIVIAISIIFLMAFMAAIFLNISLGKSRDAVRISSVSALEKTILLYQYENGVVPNDQNTLLTKNAAGVPKVLEDTLLLYISEIPTDPQPRVAANRYVYYIGDRDSQKYQLFEINVHLEHKDNAKKQETDSGDLSEAYEVGNHITMTAQNTSSGFTDPSTQIFGKTISPSNDAISW